MKFEMEKSKKISVFEDEVDWNKGYFLWNYNYSSNIVVWGGMHIKIIDANSYKITNIY